MPESGMRAVDTNVLVRLIARDDPRQTAAAETFVKQGAWVPVLALAEAAWVLATVYNRSPKDLASAVEMLLEHRDLILQSPEAVASALELFRTKPCLGFSDCLLLHVAKAAGHFPLGTFDHSLGRVEGAERL